jgi:UDP-N-acetylmuramate dehydrogenase
MTTKQMQNLPSVRGKYLFDEPMRRHTWLGVGGEAEVMFLPEDEADLQYFLRNKPQNLPVFILGGGSNLLVRDGGIKGITIKLQNKNFAQWRIENNLLICGAGMQNFALKNILPENNIGGLEFLCSIPGTIGGAFRSNAGCFGCELAQVLHHAKIMNGQGDILEITPEQFGFAYRHSDFPSDWIILEADFTTITKKSEEIIAQIKQNEDYRKEHQPQGIRTAGSTFKNPPEKAAWKLIKESGEAEMIIGGAKMSAQHCNFLEVSDNARATDVEKLCENIMKAVKTKFDVSLELEIKCVGQK